MRIALAQVPHPISFEAGLAEVLRAVAATAEAGARVVCFPECALKGMRGTAFPVEALTVSEHDAGLAAVRSAAAAHHVFVILPTERPWGDGWQNGAYLIDDGGALVGYQSKNQVPLEEEPFFQPGSERRLFAVDGVAVGIVICHEGWRYPETVRWAAARGAQIVFHPTFCGAPDASDGSAPRSRDSFYEKAMACRAAENHIWFASVNFALPIQECASSLIAPEGECVAAAPRRETALLVVDLDPEAATGYLARRLAPDRYREGFGDR